MTISKNLQKLIRSLETKKGRRKEGLFVAEGPKVVGDLMAAATPARLIATPEWFAHQALEPREQDCLVTDDELRKVSLLQHPQQVMGLFPLDFPRNNTANNCPTEQANKSESEAFALADRLAIALDGVQDPGNLGTIIRIADWFGIETIYCSMDTVDAFNPKVVQATMGSLARVGTVYCQLAQLLAGLPAGTPVYGTFLDGQSIYGQPLTRGGIIVMGNEGNGISPEVARCINRRLLIPNYPQGRATTDSLNVAIATAITCAEFRRQSS